MSYPYRSMLIVEAANQDFANMISPIITGSGLHADTFGYSIPLSATGQEPATHYGCCTAVSDEMLERMVATLTSGVLPRVKFWRWDQDTKVLLSTDVPASISQVGETWTWQKCLDDAGLSIISPGMV